MDLKGIIERIVRENLKDESYFLIDIVIRGSGGKSKVLILIDGDNGVTIDDCAELSRKITMKIESEDLIKNAYTLEVSSPGLDHPLKLKRQYTKNVGRKMQLSLRDGTVLSGKLKSTTPDYIHFEKESQARKKTAHQLLKINYQEIEKANVLVSFK